MGASSGETASTNPPTAVEVSFSLEIKDNKTGYRQRMRFLSLSLSLKLGWRKSMAVQQNSVFFLCIVFLLYPYTNPVLKL